MFNQATLVGNIGKDAETKFTASGTAVTTFSIATTRSWKDQQTNEWKEATDWHNITLWRKENLAQYLVKGKQVFVTGRIETQSWEDQKSGEKKYRTVIVADTVRLLGGKNGDAGGNREGSAEGYGNTGAASGQSSSSSSGRRGGGAATRDNSGDYSDFDGMGITDDDIPF